MATGQLCENKILNRSNFVRKTSRQFVVLQRTEFSMFQTIIKVLFFPPTANVLYHPICWKTLTFSLMTDKNYNHQTSWQIWSNCLWEPWRPPRVSVHALSVFSALCLVLRRLFISAFTGDEHNPYAKTDLPVPQKSVTCSCAIFVQMQELFLNMGRPTVQRLNSSPPALNWLMVCAMKKVEQEEGQDWKRCRAVFRMQLMKEFNRPSTWVWGEIYYAGCDLLPKATLRERRNTAPRCSSHIKAVLFASVTLWKTENFIWWICP